MKQYVVKYGTGDTDDYSAPIFERLIEADSEQQATVAAVTELPAGARIISVKPATGSQNQPHTFYNGQRVIRGSTDLLCDEELVQWLANATETHYVCNGHSKAHRNRLRADALRDKLKERGADIPDTNTLLEQGVFNGPGSS